MGESGIGCTEGDHAAQLWQHDCNLFITGATAQGSDEDAQNCVSSHASSFVHPNMKMGII